MAIETRVIRVRRGKEADLDKSKLVSGEFGAATDTQKLFFAFDTNKVKELASKAEIQGMIDSFSTVVEEEIAEAEQRIESKGQEVLDTIPDLYEEVSAKADEAVRTKADAIICTVSGVTPIAQDSSNDYARNLKLYGKTEQKQYTGKNLLENTSKTATVSGVTFTVNDDGSVIVNGTATADIYLSLSINIIDTDSAYILSGCPSNGATSTYALVYYEWDASWVQKTRNVDIGNGILINHSEEAVHAAVRITIANNTTVSNLTFSPMIRLSSITDATYEPYVGGVASPNPAYPQSLVSKGKMGNLFDKDNVTLGRYDSTGTLQTSEVWNLFEFTPDKSETSITISKMTNSSTASANVVGFKGDTITVIGSMNNATYDVSGYDKVAFSIYNNDLETAMVNYGTTALPYRPYSGQYELESGVYGGNLCPYPYPSTTKTENGMTYTDNGDGSISLSGTPTDYSSFTILEGYISGRNTIALLGTYSNCIGEILINDSSGKLVGQVSAFSGSHVLDMNEYPTAVKVVISVKRRQANTVASGTVYPIIVPGDVVPTEYEPYKSKQSHISLVGDGLKGIPVTDASLATYTDENGQMWCSDYVDCERGVLVQRVGVRVFNGTETWNKHESYYTYATTIKDMYMDYDYSSYNLSLCNSYVSKPYTTAASMIDKTSDVFYGSLGHTVRFKNNDITSLDDWEAYLAEQYTNGTPVTVQYILTEPIETPLTASEIESYKSLRSNYHVTTVMNDCDAYMDFTYNADTEIWINNKIEAKVAAVVEKLSLS